MKSLIILVLAVAMIAHAQNLETIEVETRDNPSAYLREKRQIFVPQETRPQAAVPQVVVPQVVVPQVAAPFDVLSPSSGCFWSGTSPFCFPACGKNFHEVLTDIRGDGKRCWTGVKKRCCPMPPGMIKFKG